MSRLLNHDANAFDAHARCALKMRVRRVRARVDEMSLPIRQPGLF